MGAIPPWSRDKLDLLSKYLHAYTTIMQSQKATWLRSYSFIDSFAGSGEYTDPETENYVSGSPIIALQCDPPFDSYWFIDLSPTRVDSLRANAEHLAPGRINFRQGDANNILAEEIATSITYARFQRGLVFIDPYGLQVRWDTIRVLAETKALDIFVNFPIMAINRQLPLDALPNARIRDSLARVMRDPAWVDTLYTTQMGLFGDEQSRRPSIRAERLAQLYIDDVKTLFAHVSRPVVMRNSMSAPLYALFLASHNDTAVRITNEIFDRYERL